MNTKICTKCTKEKSLEDFNFKNKTKGIKQAQCKECQSIYFKKHYSKNVEKYCKRARTSNPAAKKRNREFIISYLLEHSCVDCEETDIVVLDFDHVIGEKRETVSTMARSPYSIKSIKEEIGKCEIRCANCHRRRHSKENGFYKEGVVAPKVERKSEKLCVGGSNPPDATNQ